MTGVSKKFWEMNVISGLGFERDWVRGVLGGRGIKKEHELEHDRILKSVNTWGQERVRTILKLILVMISLDNRVRKRRHSGWARAWADAEASSGWDYEKVAT